VSAMKETLDVTLRITGVLEALGVVYAVGGSLASSLHGFPRATQDVDIVADLREDDVPALVAALRDHFYLDEAAIRTAVRDRSSFNVIHLDTLFKADLFVAKDDEPTRQELARRQRYRLPLDTPGEVDLASPEDVIVQKLYWYRLGDHVSERQWMDAQSVLTVGGELLDLRYMRQLARTMGVGDLLERALSEAGSERA
jgi:hypothetical protein